MCAGSPCRLHGNVFLLRVVPGLMRMPVRPGLSCRSVWTNLIVEYPVDSEHPVCLQQVIDGGNDADWHGNCLRVARL